MVALTLLDFLLIAYEKWHLFGNSSASRQNSLGFIFLFQLLQSTDVKEDAVLCCSLEVRETHRLVHPTFVIG